MHKLLLYILCHRIRFSIEEIWFVLKSNTGLVIIRCSIFVSPKEMNLIYIIYVKCKFHICTYIYVPQGNLISLYIVFQMGYCVGVIHSCEAQMTLLILAVSDVSLILLGRISFISEIFHILVFKDWTSCISWNSKRFGPWTLLNYTIKPKYNNKPNTTFNNTKA